MLDGAEIAIVDHTALPTEIAKKCTGLKHVVFLGTGARSYMNPEELAELGIHGAPDQGLWRYGGRRMRHRADVGGRARPRQDGPRDPRRQLAARRRHAADRQDARPDRLRRHRRGSRAHRARQRHARDRLEPVAEETSEGRIRRARRVADRERRDLDPSAAQRRDPRPGLARLHRGDEARRHPRQHRARRDRRRGSDDRGAEIRPDPPCRPRRLQHRAAAGGSSADETAQRDAVGAFRVPHAGGEREFDRARRGQHCRRIAKG